MWIKVEDRLPEPYTKCLVYGTTKNGYKMMWTQGFYTVKFHTVYKNRKITHWQPLPQPPDND